MLLPMQRRYIAVCERGGGRGDHRYSAHHPRRKLSNTTDGGMRSSRLIYFSHHIFAAVDVDVDAGSAVVATTTTILLDYASSP